MVKFKKIKIVNFLSVGNHPLEIDFQRNQLTLVNGTNGVGKSAVTIDSLTFGLFGKSYRPIKKNQLINSINGRGSMIEVSFDVRGKEYMVRRGIKPDVFEIFEDGKMLNQEAASRDYQKHLEENILGMSLKTFKQVVILSVSYYTPFMDLSAADRRRIVEDLLDIQVFSVMNEVLLEQRNELKEGKSKLLQKTQLLDVEIRGLESKINSLKAKDQSLVAGNMDKIREANDVIAERMTEVDNLQAQIEELNGSLGDIKTLQEQRGKLVVVVDRLSEAKKKLTKEIDFFTDNDDCPVCSQHIEEALRDDKVTQKTKKVGEIAAGEVKAKGQISSLVDLINEADTTARKIQSLNNEITKQNASIRANQKYIQELEKTNESILSKGDDEEQTERASLKVLVDQRDAIDTKLTKVAVREDDYAVCVKLLKDNGIKAQIIDIYIPTINKILNHYLELFDFPVSFTFDKNFNEVIRSRYRDEFSYANFSMGERARIDVCIVLTFREIAAMKNSISTSLLILDEIAENVDSAGIEKYLEIIRGLKDTNCLMITHRSEIKETVHTQINLSKTDGFTVMEH